MTYPVPNLLKVVQRARPSYNPRGTIPRWAERPAAPNETILHIWQFLSTREIRGEVREMGVDECHRAHAVAAALAGTIQRLFMFFLMFLTFSSHPLTSSEVVPRARPSYNPRGTCPRCAERPAAPRWTILLSQQFFSTREWGKISVLTCTSLSSRMVLHKYFSV
jgi:hypothetical protein